MCILHTIAKGKLMNNHAIKPDASDLAHRALALAIDLLAPYAQNGLNVDSRLAELGRQLAVADSAYRALEDGPHDAFEKAHAVCSSIVAAIEACQAETIDGLAVKASAVLWCRAGEPLIPDNEGSTTDERLAYSVVHDLLKMKSSQNQCGREDFSCV
jgi:hypothetical protein